MTGPAADVRVHQIFFGFRKPEGMQVLATSLPDADPWFAVLDEHLRLLRPPATSIPEPDHALSYFVFGRNAVVLRRSRGSDPNAGRNPAQALVGRVEHLGPELALGLGSWDGWRGTPDDDRVPVVRMAELAAVARSAESGLRRDARRRLPLVHELLAHMLDRPDVGVTVVGVPEPDRAAVAWGLCAAGRPLFDASRNWSFSTYEIDHGDDVDNRPELVFLPDLPAGPMFADRIVVDAGRTEPTSLRASRMADDAIRRFRSGTRTPRTPQRARQLVSGQAEQAFDRDPVHGDPVHGDPIHGDPDNGHLDHGDLDHGDLDHGTGGHAKRTGAVVDTARTYLRRMRDLVPTGASPADPPQFDDRRPPSRSHRAAPERAPRTPAGQRADSAGLSMGNRAYALANAATPQEMVELAEAWEQQGRSAEGRARLRAEVGADGIEAVALRAERLLGAQAPDLLGGLVRALLGRRGLDDLDTTEPGDAPALAAAIAAGSGSGDLVRALVAEAERRGRTDLLHAAVAHRWFAENDVPVGPLRIEAGAGAGSRLDRVREALPAALRGPRTGRILAAVGLVAAGVAAGVAGTAWTRPAVDVAPPAAAAAPLTGRVDTAGGLPVLLYTQTIGDPASIRLEAQCATDGPQWVCPRPQATDPAREAVVAAVPLSDVPARTGDALPPGAVVLLTTRL